MSVGFLSQYGEEIATLTAEHVWLTAAAMVFATMIAVPTGIWLTRAPRWAKPIIGVTNILQTIPSLAMFGFLLPLAVAWGARGADRDFRTDGLCIASHLAQYVRGHSRHRSIGD